MSVTVIARQNNCPRYAANFLPVVDDITTKAVFDTHAAADPNTPVDEGDLKGNVVDTPSSGGQGGQVHWLMDYAAHVAFGTVHMAGRPFAQDAANQVFPQWVQNLGQIEGRL